ncbi:MAG TPA: hypothetical protein VM100_07935, partial [Longimicrobiales bacterium]|nr:hypothetical protein [Longimicrobiales bacterium]
MRRFIAELKRRHVFRVATVYLVAAWVGIQVATTVFPILHFPSWAITAAVVAAIVGFPVTLIISWAFDLTAEGVELTDEPSRRIRLPWLKRGMAAFLIVILIAGGYAFYLRVKPGEAKSSPSVAIFPFTVEAGTSLSYLGEGIVNLLNTSVNGLGTMRSVDPTTLLNSLSAGERAEVTKEVAQRIAQKVGATAFIIGKIEGSPEKLQLSAQMYDVAGKADPVPAAVVGTEDKILDYVDQIAGVLLTGTMQDAASRLSRAAAITT